MRLGNASFALGVLVAGCAFGQYVISAHSGVVQTVDGRAYLNDKAVDVKFGQFPDIKNNQEFRTEEGRAEILLTPGVFLRMGENSSIRMVSNELSDTRVEVLTGAAMVECDEAQKGEAKDNAITLIYKGHSALLLKHGLYRLDTNPASFKVYEGEAIVKGESGQVTLKAGKETSLTGVLMAESFDKKAADELYLWSNQRSGYLAQASASSAMTLRNGSYSAGSYSPWQWNPMFGMFTFVPYSGIAYSPFGWGFWSPYSVLGYYPYYGGYYGGGGYYSGYRNSGGQFVGRGSPSVASGGNRGIVGSPFGAGRAYSGGGFGGVSGGRSGGGMAVGGGGGGMAAGGGGGHAGGGGGGGGHGR